MEEVRLKEEEKKWRKDRVRGMRKSMEKERQGRESKKRRKKEVFLDSKVENKNSMT